MAVTHRARELLAAAGTPTSSVPLAILGAIHLAANALWTSTDVDAQPLAGTWPWWTLAVAMVADALVSVLRTLPWRQRPDGTLQLEPVGPRRLGAVMLGVGWLLVAIAFVASTAARDRFLFRVAVGERFAASPEQLVRRDPLRALSGRPVPVDLEVVGVEGGSFGPGLLRATVRSPTGRSEVVGRVWPKWLGWVRYLRAVRAGVAVRYEVTAGAGAAIDGAFAKLDSSDPEGQFVRLEGVPIRLHLALPAGDAVVAGAPPSLGVRVYRWKYLVAEGVVRGGKPIAFDDLNVSFPEWRPWVELEMVRDPGIPPGILGALLAFAGVLLRVVMRTDAAPASGGSADNGDTPGGSG